MTRPTGSGADRAASDRSARPTIAEVEDRFADAWAAHNRAEIAAIIRPDDPAGVAAARERERRAVAAAIAGLDALTGDSEDRAAGAASSVDPVGRVTASADPERGSRFDADDRRAIAAMAATLELLANGDPGLSLAVADERRTHDDRSAEEVLASDGLAGLLQRMTAAYSAAADAIEVDGERLDRPGILARLATDPEPAMRRRLFLALEPVWWAVDGDGGPTSPYRVALRASAEAWRRDGSPVDANARALGIDPGDVEPWLRAILETWRAAAVRETLEPWDERFAGGAFARAFPEAVPLAELERIDRESYAALGADPLALGVRHDLAPRPGRGPVPVAFMLDVDIPRRTEDGWTPGEQWIFASYGQPRIPDLGELLHETGHAIHSRAIRSRPAFAVLPERLTTLIEALGDLAAWDLHEPAWQARRLGRTVPLEVGLRARYADVVRDVAWSLFEIILHRTPERPPNDVWTEITETSLGIRAHPEWSWWAVRGQLVQSPGYMVNYGLGAIVTADLRGRLRELRGDWLEGDPGWYDAVSATIYRWGAERDGGELLREVLGRSVSPDALLADLGRLA